MKTDYWWTGQERIDRWGPGPWVDEPDRVEWVHQESQYFCLILRHSGMGSLTGYVAVPPGHPLHGKHASSVYGRGVHGGVNFSEPGETGQHINPAYVGHWFFGFDAAHADTDFVPQFQTLGLGSFIKGTQYRDFRYMRENTERLAWELYERRDDPPPELRITYTKGQA